MSLILKFKSEKSYEFPLDRFYWMGEPGHTWGLPQEENILKIGIDSIATEHSGNILSIRSKKLDSKINQGNSIGTFESDKWIGVIRSPFSGQIIKINDHVIKDPSIIAQNPYEAWIIAIKLTKYENDLKNSFLIKIGDKLQLKKYIEVEYAKYNSD